MSEYRISNDEFDYMLELIAAVLFMAVGVIGIVFMVRQFNRQVQLNPRVDKVRVSSIDQQEGNPFDFTAYQAYMMAWMMDGHDKTALYYFSTDDQQNKLDSAPISGSFPKSGGYIGLCPAELANGFIVVRNRAIIGADEFAPSNGLSGSGVKNIIYAAYGDNESAVEKGYRGENGAEWILEFTDKHVGYLTEDYVDGNPSNLFEERKDYIWSLHRCNHASP